MAVLSPCFIWNILAGELGADKLRQCWLNVTISILKTWPLYCVDSRHFSTHNNNCDGYRNDDLTSTTEQPFKNISYIQWLELTEDKLVSTVTENHCLLVIASCLCAPSTSQYQLLILWARIQCSFIKSASKIPDRSPETKTYSSQSRTSVSFYVSQNQKHIASSANRERHHC